MASLRAKKAAKIFVEKRGKSVSAAMREAGYSEKTAKNPKNLTNQKSWAQLMEQYLPQDLIATKHAELLEAEDIVFIPRGKKIIEKRRPDYQARRAGVEMAHKLHGNFAPEQLEITRRKYQTLSHRELQEKLRLAKEKFAKGKK